MAFFKVSAQGFMVAAPLEQQDPFAEAYPDQEFVQEILTQIPWHYNQALLDKLKAPDKRLWYAQGTIKNGWSRNILVVQSFGLSAQAR